MTIQQIFREGKIYRLTPITDCTVRRQQQQYRVLITLQAGLSSKGIITMVKSSEATSTSSN
jgi:hypothetical protein